MTSLSIYHRDFVPYIPAIDARRLDKPGVISGQNFYHDIDGPRSAFTSNFAHWWKWSAADRVNFSSFQIDNTWIYANNSGLWKIDAISHLPQLILPVTVTNLYWPWTYAQVGNLHYFAQYNIGLWQFNALTNTFALIATPSAVKFICQSYGRLVCLSALVVFWSALDAGTDFTPSLTTGAGFQVLSLLSNNAFRVDPVEDGMIIATDLGLIKGEFVQANFVFRWYVISRDVFIFSPNCGVILPDVGLILLDPFGFHITNGAKPKVWEPEMSEYLKLTYLDGTDKTKFGVIKLNLSSSLNSLFVSFSAISREGIYQNSFFYYLPTAKWGVFFAPHLAIVDLDVISLIQDVAGYIDSDGYMRYFTRAQFTELQPLFGYDLAEFVWRPSDEGFMVVIDGVFYGSTEIICQMVDPFLFVDKPAGLYQVLADGTTVSGYVPPHGGPNAYIDLGPFRFAEQKEADETSLISTLVIGTTAATGGTILTEDWNTSDNSADWNIEGVDEDWGTSIQFQDSFLLDLIATDDGVNQQLQGPERLDVVENVGAAFQYEPSGYSAIFHRIRLTAMAVDTSFSVKFISMAGHPTGRHI